MNTIPTACPFCGGEMQATRLHCRECDTHVEGRFSATSGAQLLPEQKAFVDHFVARLKPEQLVFVETFVRCEGRLNRMESELGVSYPTIRNRLNEIISSLGYEPGSDEPPTMPSQPAGMTDAQRLSVLEQLDNGQISAEDAMRLLQESEG